MFQLSNTNFKNLETIKKAFKIENLKNYYFDLRKNSVKINFVKNEHNGKFLYYFEGVNDFTQSLNDELKTLNYNYEVDDIDLKNGYGSSIIYSLSLKKTVNDFLIPNRLNKIIEITKRNPIFDLISYDFYVNTSIIKNGRSYNINFHKVYFKTIEDFNLFQKDFENYCIKWFNENIYIEIDTIYDLKFDSCFYNKAFSHEKTLDAIFYIRITEKEMRNV